MSTFQNVTDESLYVPLAGRTVQPGDTFEVEKDLDSAFAEQPAFAKASKKSTPAEVPAPSEGDK